MPLFFHLFISAAADDVSITSITDDFEYDPFFGPTDGKIYWIMDFGNVHLPPQCS